MIDEILIRKTFSSVKEVVTPLDAKPALVDTASSAEISFSVDADSISGENVMSPSGVSASLTGFEDIKSSYVDVARVGDALRFGQTQAMIATLPAN